MKDSNLRCPYCLESGGLTLEPNTRSIQHIICNRCGRPITIQDGIPNFAPHIPVVEPCPGVIQKLNNCPTFTRLYETPLWRGFLTHLGSGMTMRREVMEVLRIAGAVSPKLLADIACGTGHYARAFADAYPEARVYGMDVSLAMLRQAQKKARSPHYGNIFFVRGDIHLIPLADRSMDVVNCCGALHLFTTLQPIWREISRILRPGGVFCGWTLVAHSQGPERSIQNRLMRRRKATFFHPVGLADDLRVAGLRWFRWNKRRAWLLFRAVKAAEEDNSSL